MKLVGTLSLSSVYVVCIYIVYESAGVHMLCSEDSLRDHFSPLPCLKQGLLLFVADPGRLV